MGCHPLLQGIFPTQGSNPGLPFCRHSSRFFKTEPPGKHPQQISVIYITERIILRFFPSLYEQRAGNYLSRRTEPENLRLTPDSASSTLSETLSSLTPAALHVKWTWKKLFHEVGAPGSDIVEVNTLMVIGYYSTQVLKDLKTKLWNDKKKSAVWPTSWNWFQAHHWFHIWGQQETSSPSPFSASTMCHG